MIDMTGEKYGYLTVIGFSHKDKKSSYWRCKCKCGKEKISRRGHLMDGSVSSCGCKLKEPNAIKHGLWSKDKRIYKIWSCMIDRCYNNKRYAFKDYGGRGISVYQEWIDTPMSFYNWAINNGYKDNLSIDRINNNGNYEPSNCRWADNFIQGNNRRNNNTIKLWGNEKTLSEWGRFLNINPERIRKRVKRRNVSWSDSVKHFIKEEGLLWI